MEKKSIKKQKKGTSGITLVALVVTVVVLIILATITVNIALNGGIADRTQKAKVLYEDGEQREQELIQNLTEQLNNRVAEVLPEEGSGPNPIEYGKITINSALELFDTTCESTVLYQVTGKIDDEIVYSNIFPIYFNKEGSQSIQVDNIPTSAKVTVSQIYITPCYKEIGEKVKECVATPEGTESISKVFFEIAATGNNLAVKGKVSTSYFYYNESGYTWNSNEQSQISPANFTTFSSGGPGELDVVYNVKVNPSLSNNALSISVKNEEGETAPVYVRAKIFVPEGMTCNPSYVTGWGQKEDGYYYKTDILDVMDEEKFVTIPVENLKNRNKNFNIAVAVEYVGVSYDDGGAPYADWKTGAGT